MSESHQLHRDPTVEEFLDQHRTTCAAWTITTGQYIRYQLAVLAAAVLFCHDWKVFAAALLFACSAFYVTVIGYKLLTVMLSCLLRPEIHIDSAEVEQAAPEDMPMYTVLVPLYKERAEAVKILHTMETLAYPRDKLDVKLLLEEDDPETLAALQAEPLPDYIEIMVLPHSFPKTKPKACNHGLRKARGEFLVIYDAEDRPDCDQLVKAVLAFRRSADRVTCLQAKLNYYNPDQNWLTRWFTLEYTTWFDLFLPGLHALGAPIPLGGTSNHFKTEVLRELGGWDPFNLTEDADLGIRLHATGYRTQVLDSVTWEEANSQVGNWIRQRSRWVKGYIQTHFAHMRSNLLSIGRLGLFGWFSTILTVGGLSATLLLNPLFWIIGLVYLLLWGAELTGLSEVGPWQMYYDDTVGDLPGSPLTLWSQLSIGFWAAAVALVMANAIFIGIALLACLRRGLWRMVPQALLSPLYWVLISVAAWKGFLQLFTRPFYWEKTTHGLCKQEQDEGVCHIPEGAKS